MTDTALSTAMATALLTDSIKIQVLNLGCEGVSYHSCTYFYLENICTNLASGLGICIHWVWGCLKMQVSYKILNWINLYISGHWRGQIVLSHMLKICNSLCHLMESRQSFLPDILMFWRYLRWTQLPGIITTFQNISCNLVWLVLQLKLLSVKCMWKQYMQIPESALKGSSKFPLSHPIPWLECGHNG